MPSPTLRTGLQAKVRRTLRRSGKEQNGGSALKNLNLFLESPEEYAPQYGGYCAWAAANEKLAKGNPLVYTLLDRKLYLNFIRKVDQKWQQNRAEFIEKANALYPILVQIK